MLQLREKLQLSQFHIFKNTLTQNNAYYEGDEYLYCFELRYNFIKNCFYGCIDLICLFFGLLSILTITRFIAFFILFISRTYHLFWHQKTLNLSFFAHLY